MARPQRVDQAVDRGDVAGEAERARRAGVDQQGQLPRWLRGRRGGRVRGEAHRADHQVVGGHRGGRGHRRRDEVAIRLPVALAQRLALRGAVERGPGELDVDLRGLRQAAQRQRVAATDQLLRERQHQVLVGARPDGEHPRAELVAGGLLEQRGVLPPMQEIIVGAARDGAADDLGLLPAAVQLHREARHRRARRQRDRERALAGAVFGVVEVEMELGERQRPLDHGAGVDAAQLQAAAIGRGQRPRRRGDRVGRGGRRRGGDHQHRRDRPHRARRRGAGPIGPLARLGDAGLAPGEGDRERDEHAPQGHRHDRSPSPDEAAAAIPTICSVPRAYPAGGARRDGSCARGQPRRYT